MGNRYEVDAMHELGDIRRAARDERAAKVLRLRDEEGLGSAEIGERLRISPGSVPEMVRRARRLLGVRP